MAGIPDGRVKVRAFVPSKDYAVSKRFYERLGFEKLFDGQIALFRIGDCEVLIQDFYEKKHAENYMMQLLVDYVDAWWKYIESLELTKEFDVQPPRPPAMQPWGLRVSYLFDPSGVLWHVAQWDKK